MGEIFDARYVYAIGCTWHGPVQQAGKRIVPLRPLPTDEQMTLPCCPHCGSTLLEQPTAEDWWASVRRFAKGFPECEAMMRWSEGKCFPDLDTLQNAYRQAKEE